MTNEVRNFLDVQPSATNRGGGLFYENRAREKGFSIIVGIDEAGRGPLAGPVVASAVCLKDEKFICKIADSKKLSARQREHAFEEIFSKADVGIGIVGEKTIDAINILNATFEAMSLAVSDLVKKFTGFQTEGDPLKARICLLIDGNRFKSNLPYAYETIIRGDDASLSIACASIIAKVTRDRMLADYDKIYPQYGFLKHKGYPTLAHKKAIAQHGLSPIHRKSFHHPSSPPPKCGGATPDSAGQVLKTGQ